METVPSILIIDDHKDFREALKSFILVQGIKADILEAMTAQDGMEIAVQKAPQVVIIDIHLRSGSGKVLEMAASLKKQDASCGIIILTMYARDDIRSFCDTRDIDDIIDKNDLDKRLVPAINRLLSVTEKV
ncbi:MAG: response regulator [Candidatus Omnitrophica bacterium]|nr:response regulator [Candidatus Omnitrophota bacterium]